MSSKPFNQTESDNLLNIPTLNSKTVSNQAITIPTFSSYLAKPFFASLVGMMFCINMQHAVAAPVQPLQAKPVTDIPNLQVADRALNKGVTITQSRIITTPDAPDKANQETATQDDPFTLTQTTTPINSGTKDTKVSRTPARDGIKEFIDQNTRDRMTGSMAIESEQSNYPETAEADAEDAVVAAKVDKEIREQTQSDMETGQAVAMDAATEDDSIDSIESTVQRDGKKLITTSLTQYANRVNGATWSPNMRKNTAMTVKLQALLDWNHASPGPIDGGWGMNSKKALANFQAMRNLPRTGSMDAATWRELTKNIDLTTPVVIEYTLTKKDINSHFANIPSGSEAKSKLKGLYYQNIKEMLGERFHMDVRYLEKLNKGKKFVAGETISVINVNNPLKARINRVVANKKDKTLYAYNGDQLVATYPTTVGSTDTPSPHGTFKIVNKVKMPWYKATVGEGSGKKVYMLPPGPNNPVGVVWMGLSKPSYGLHGSPIPEGISRQASHGCIRLTNWDVLEVYANIEKGAKVELQ